MTPFILIALAALGFLLIPKAEASEELEEMINLSTSLGPLPDIDPLKQGGGYSRAYDDAFKRASDNWNVPFALLKAHAIQESSLIKTASRNEPATSKRPPSRSYGLMQLLWWPGSDRFSKFNWSADRIGDGSVLYDEYINTDLAAQLINDNFKVFKNLRDSINAYNTGVAEGTRQAPGDYVNKVLNYYTKIAKREIVA